MFFVYRYYFRISRSGFENLLVILGNAINDHNFGRPPMPLDKSLLLFLQYLATQETMTSIAQRFGVAVGTVHGTIHSLLDVITPTLSHQYIGWPNGPDELRNVAQGFQTKSPNLPTFIVGSIDCCEVPVMPPIEDPASYFNRKHYYSVKLQAIVDHIPLFRDVFIGWPGRSHDARTFTNSPIFTMLDNQPSLLPHNYFIVGDSAYPLKVYLMTPFKHLAATPQQKRYNKAISKARIMVECAFGQVKNRWRRMKFIHMHSIEKICKLINAACTLHNFCHLHHEEVFEEDLPNVLEDINNGNQVNIADMNANQRRNSLLQLF